MAQSPGRHVIISNGNGRFHMSWAAAEIHARGRLAGLHTAGYPGKGLIGAALKGRLARLDARSVNLPDDRVAASWSSEILWQIARLLRGRTGLDEAGKRLDLCAHGRLAKMSARVIGDHNDAGIFHYRAGYGGPAVAAARQAGMIALCDHSIAHPALLHWLVSHDGRLPGPDDHPQPDRIWRAIAADIARADHVLVNSDFVADTFRHQGHDMQRVTVIYQGVDDSFLPLLDSPDTRPADGPVRLLFAGLINRRKGLDDIMAALEGLDAPGAPDWRLTLAGPVTATDRQRLARLFDHPRVTHAGMLDRASLANAMKAHDALLFPSLAEGSARVAFEAMAAGMWIICTPNTGSVVEDGVHGRLIAPGAPQEIVRAVRELAENRASCHAGGARGAQLVRKAWTQSAFGDRLIALYDRLLDDHRKAD